MQVPIVAITGTKGKSTTTYIAAEVFGALGRNVLRVDTTGHYLNSEQLSSLDDSKEMWGLVPTVAPGRYLWEFFARPELQPKGIAVLESSLGSSSLAGMGYRVHQVGVFLNVFEDHLGSSARIKSRDDIARAKQFIFERLDYGGWAVFNADDPLVTKSLKALPDHLDINLLPCGLEFTHFDLPAHLAAGGLALTVKNDCISLLKGNQTTKLIDVKSIPWTFDARYLPSVWNLLMSAGAVLAAGGGKWSAQTSRVFTSVRLDPYGGRLTLLSAANGATILADYAHEKKSMVEIARLGKSLTKNGGKVIGVLRLANDRSRQLIRETGAAVAGEYDQLIIYDKIDGHLRKPRPRLLSSRFAEKTGLISQILSEAAEAAGGQVERVVREDEAACRAAELAGPDDVVIYIVNDDVKRSIGFIRDSFKAEFV